MAKRKQHWYVGEIIKSIFGRDTYEVISAMSSKEKYKNGLPVGHSKRIVWYYETRGTDDGCFYKFNVAQVKDDGWFELVTPVEERLWNL